MTPKEKAKELFKKFNEYADSNYGASNFEKNWFGNTLSGERKVRKESAKQCALIAVDQIIKAGKDVDEFAESYWYKVKQEIENL